MQLVPVRLSKEEAGYLGRLIKTTPAVDATGNTPPTAASSAGAGAAGAGKKSGAGGASGAAAGSADQAAGSPNGLSTWSTQESLFLGEPWGYQSWRTTEQGRAAVHSELVCPERCC